MAIKVLSLAENGYRRLANAITVTVLMHTTFSPLTAGPFSAFFQQPLKPLQRTEPFSSFFSSSFSNLCNKRTHLKWHFLQFQSCVDASLDKMGWINASFVHAKKKIKGDLTIPIFWEFFLLFTRSWNWMMLWGNLEGNDDAMILLHSFLTSEWLK